MPLFRAMGLDERSGRVLELFVEAEHGTEARAFAEARLARVDSVVEAGPDERPATAPVFSAGAYLASRAAERKPPTTTARLYVRAMFGVGLACVIIIGFLFVVKAREHLGRRDVRTAPPPDQSVPPAR